MNYKSHAVVLSTAAFLLGSGALLAQAPAVPTYNAEAVQKGLSISPVTIDFGTRDRNQVGYGSYLVNAVGGCNDCHTNPPFKADGNPFMGMKKGVNTAGFLAGGVAFGPFNSRNLTPGNQGPSTGSLEKFKQAFQQGVDHAKLHPQIAPNLQVMPWPVYQDMTAADVEAIFAYLSSIPCVEGGPGEKPGRCAPATPTTAVAEPKNSTASAFQINLDATKSVASDGKDLKYSWSLAKGSPVATILGADTAKPAVQFGTRGPVSYTFELTVTDSKGVTASDTVSVLYVGR